MITGEEYRASLRDGRAVWLEGRRVEDVTAHPLLRKSVDWVASTYPSSVNPHRKPSGKPDEPPAAHSLVGACTDEPSEEVAVTDMTARSVATGSGSHGPT